MSDTTIIIIAIIAVLVYLYFTGKLDSLLANITGPSVDTVYVDKKEVPLNGHLFLTHTELLNSTELRLKSKNLDKMRYILSLDVDDKVQNIELKITDGKIRDKLHATVQKGGSVFTLHNTITFATAMKASDKTGLHIYSAEKFPADLTIDDTA